MTDFGKRIVIGTPVTPKRLLPTLAGSSFCVSFADPRDLDRAIELVGDREILILDNGAFSHWRKGRGAIDREAFWAWANEAQARSPQAVAVIPDVIEGTEAENLLEVELALGGLARFPDRIMSIWHLNESLEQLRTLAEATPFLGFGSCAEYDVQRRRQAYLGRVEEAAAVVDQVEPRPWIHLMRGLGVFAELTAKGLDFQSADSTNIAVNHIRYKAKHGANRARFMLDRITNQIRAAVIESNGHRIDTLYHLGI